MPSTCTARFVVSCCEKPALYVLVSGFCSLSSTMVMLAGPVHAKASGLRPPYGSGYVGFEMRMLACSRLVCSPPNGVPKTGLRKYLPAPPRTTDSPSPRRSQATPTRGPMLLWSPRVDGLMNGSGFGNRDRSIFWFHES